MLVFNAIDLMDRRWAKEKVDVQTKPVGDVPFKRETRIVSTHVIATSRGRGEAFKI